MDSGPWTQAQVRPVISLVQRLFTTSHLTNSKLGTRNQKLRAALPGLPGTHTHAGLHAATPEFWERPAKGRHEAHAAIPFRPEPVFRSSVCSSLHLLFCHHPFLTTKPTKHTERTSDAD